MCSQNCRTHLLWQNSPRAGRDPCQCNNLTPVTNTRTDRRHYFKVDDCAQTLRFSWCPELMSDYSNTQTQIPSLAIFTHTCYGTLYSSTSFPSKNAHSTPCHIQLTKTNQKRKPAEAPTKQGNKRIRPVLFHGLVADVGILTHFLRIYLFHK